MREEYIKMMQSIEKVIQWESTTCANDSLALEVFFKDGVKMTIEGTEDNPVKWESLPIWLTFWMVESKFTEDSGASAIYFAPPQYEGTECYRWVMK